MDRDNKDTLPLTAPRSVAKSSTEDLKPGESRNCHTTYTTPPRLWSSIEGGMAHSLRFRGGGPRTPSLFWQAHHLSPAGRRRRSRADSDLEAFSRNPSDDSFASLSVRINAIPNIRINGSSRTESNYCLDGPTTFSSVG